MTKFPISYLMGNIYELYYFYPTCIASGFIYELIYLYPAPSASGNHLLLKLVYMVRMNLSTYFSNCLNFSVLSLSSYFSNPYVLIRHPPSCFSKSIKDRTRSLLLPAKIPPALCRLPLFHPPHPLILLSHLY